MLLQYYDKTMLPVLYNPWVNVIPKPLEGLMFLAVTITACNMFNPLLAMLIMFTGLLFCSYGNI